MKTHNLLFILFLSILFASCTPNAAIIASPTAVPAPTYTPTPITFEFMPAENQAKEFLEADGELDTSLLNSEQRKDFSSALVKELNTQRGAYPTTFKDEAYLDYDSFRMKNLTDGSNPEKQTFPLFLPVTVDEDGHLKVKRKTGFGRPSRDLVVSIGTWLLKKPTIRASSGRFPCRRKRLKISTAAACGSWIRNEKNRKVEWQRSPSSCLIKMLDRFSLREVLRPERFGGGSCAS